MTRFVGLDVSQKLTTICVVDDTGCRVWRGQCTSDPELIERAVRWHAGDDARLGIETGPMTPWLVHELRGQALDVTPSVPTRVRHRPPRSLDSTGWKDDLTHAYGSDAERRY